MKAASLAVIMTLAAGLTSSAHAQTQPSSANKTKPDTQKTSQQPHTDQDQHQDEGERIFEANCSRCHNTPEGFSPRISGTIVRHMRMRASLSAHDEQELLRFFNP